MRFLVLVALAGCRSILGFDDVASTDADAAIDAPLACTTWTFRPVEFDPCAIPPPNGDLPLGSDAVWTLDGDTGQLSGPGSTTALLPRTAIGSVVVLSVGAFTVETGAKLRVTGTAPVVIAAFGALHIDGALEVNSSQTDGAGPGATSASCGSSAGTAGTDGNNGGGSGGGGGGYAAAGGGGGRGGSGATLPGVAGVARVAPIPLQAGCPGGTGGNNAGGAGLPGVSGAGGGAIALVARDALVVTGTVNAGGAGGGGGSTNKVGGGGGGSGGMIVLEADRVEVTTSATVAANGGQGGGGCTLATAGPGEDGVVGTAAASIANSEGNGSDGGAGGALVIPVGTTAADANAGAGGGGGGVGFIVFTAHAGGATIDSLAAVSPTPVAR